MDGIIIINKPQGFTSQDVVSKTKKILNVKKAGHTGTLDPLATGVLPVLLGNYTKLSKYLIEHNKVYRAKIKFGEMRDTGDLEGKVIEKTDVKLQDEEQIKKVLHSFLGKQMQKPPMYSAIKINGKKLYEYARAGEKVEVPKREIEIYKLEFISFCEEVQELDIEVSCSKGTYIRVLCEDIAKKLGSLGYMAALNRIFVDKFSIDSAISFEVLEENKSNQKFLDEHLIKMEDVFSYFPKLEINSRKLNLLLNGVKLSVNIEDGVYNIYSDGKYIGLGTVKNELLKRDVII
jgi:tRNA pseudouridine55 synthase